MSRMFLIISICLIISIQGQEKRKLSVYLCETNLINLEFENKPTQVILGAPLKLEMSSIQHESFTIDRITSQRFLGTNIFETEILSFKQKTLTKGIKEFFTIDTVRTYPGNGYYGYRISIESSGKEIACFTYYVLNN
mgnify:CR=1 FL=1